MEMLHDSYGLVQRCNVRHKRLRTTHAIVRSGNRFSANLVIHAWERKTFTTRSIHDLQLSQCARGVKAFHHCLIRTSNAENAIDL